MGGRTGEPLIISFWGTSLLKSLATPITPRCTARLLLCLRVPFLNGYEHKPKTSRAALLVISVAKELIQGTSSTPDMARTTLGIITCDNQIICPRVGQCVDVFQVPDQSCARIARPLGRRPAAQLEKSIVYGIQTNSAEVVTFGDLSTRSTLHFAIEHCNKAQPVPLGRLKLRSKKKDKHDSVHNLLSKLRPGQRAVACVRGVALLRWREGDEWAAYHLVRQPSLKHLCCMMPPNGNWGKQTLHPVQTIVGDYGLGACAPCAVSAAHCAGPHMATASAAEGALPVAR